jgi:hypothetical protein
VSDPLPPALKPPRPGNDPTRVISDAEGSKAGRDRRAAGRREPRGRPALTRALALLLAPLPSRQPPRHESDWGSSGAGERALASALERHCPDLPVLRGRRLGPAPRAFGHVALAPSGVWVIDLARLRGPVRVESARGDATRLLIGGRESIFLIDGLHARVLALRALLDELDPPVPVRGCLCLARAPWSPAGAGLPLLRALYVRGYPLYSPSRLARRLAADGPCDAARMRALHAELGLMLPPV